MPQQRSVVICTVGVSLLNNLAGASDAAVRHALEMGEWGELGRFLAKHYPRDHRILGAELNSIAELVKKKEIALNTIWFLVSETDEGRKTQDILKGYFDEASWAGAHDVGFVTVEGLQDTRPDQFRSRGLRNLVREMAKIVRMYGPQTVVIDATGGYKAQIALAVVFGQAMDIPVYYKHERFKYIIDLPPLPITLDYEILGQNGWLLQRLEDNEVLTNDDIGQVDDKVKVLLQDVRVEGETLWELSPVGQVYLEGFRQRIVPCVNLTPASKRREPTFSDHHRPKFYEDFVKKVWRENPWIYTCVDLGSDNQRAMKYTRFFTREAAHGTELIGEYVADYGARFKILTDCDKPHELSWAAMTLNKLYAK